MSQQQPQLNNHADLLLQIQNNQGKQLRKNTRMKVKARRKGNFLFTLFMLFIIIFGGLYLAWLQGKLPASLHQRLDLPFIHVQGYISTVKQKVKEYSNKQKESNISQANSESLEIEPEIKTIQDRLKELQAKQNNNINQDNNFIVGVKDKFNNIVSNNSILSNSRDKLVSIFGSKKKTDIPVSKEKYNYEVKQETTLEEELGQAEKVNNNKQILPAVHSSSTSSKSRYNSPSSYSRRKLESYNSLEQDDIFFGKYRIADSYTEKLYQSPVYSRRVSKPNKQITFKTTYLSPTEVHRELDRRLNSQNYYLKRELYNAYSRSGKAVYEYSNSNGDELFISFRPSLDHKTTTWKYIFY